MRPLAVVMLCLFVFGTGVIAGTVATFTLLKGQNQQLSQMYRDKADEATKYKVENIGLRTENVLLKAGAR